MVSCDFDSARSSQQLRVSIFHRLPGRKWLRRLRSENLRPIDSAGFNNRWMNSIHSFKIEKAAGQKRSLGFKVAVRQCGRNTSANCDVTKGRFPEELVLAQAFLKSKTSRKSKGWSFAISMEFTDRTETRHCWWSERLTVWELSKPTLAELDVKKDAYYCQKTTNKTWIKGLVLPSAFFWSCFFNCKMWAGPGPLRHLLTPAANQRGWFSTRQASARFTRSLISAGQKMKTSPSTRKRPSSTSSLPFLLAVSLNFHIQAFNGQTCWMFVF